jgi:hypothetical protein
MEFIIVKATVDPCQMWRLHSSKSTMLNKIRNPWGTICNLEKNLDIYFHNESSLLHTVITALRRPASTACARNDSFSQGNRCFGTGKGKHLVSSGNLCFILLSYIKCL